VKTAVVTGGNRGIGRAITEALVQGGFFVHVLCQSGQAEPCENTRLWQADLRNYAAAERILEELGEFDVLVNNAGIMNKMVARDYDEASILEITHLNLITPVRLSVWFAEKFKTRGGRVVSIGSVAGEIGHPDTWYGVSKAGLDNAMRSLSRTYGGLGFGFFTVAPGPVETDMQAQNDEARKARLKGATIHQRFASVEEVAEIVAWLATRAPLYMTGQTLDLNSGTNFR
jgi:NAD(P)-dependent dehydrogenase (short-subunit alcohol dehydrogenase family)